MNMKDLHERTGAAIQRAAKDLPEGYEITVELEQGAGTVRLFVPAYSDNESGEVINEFSGDDIAYEIENAIDYAIEHKINAES
jgi:hypothetical protein